MQIRRALPKLLIFNAKPVDKYTKNEQNDRVDAELLVGSEGQKDRDGTKEKKNVKHHPMSENEDDNLETIGKKSSTKRKKTDDVVSKKDVIVHDDENTVQNKDMGNKSIKKKQRNNDKPQKEGLVLQENVTKFDKKQKKSKNRGELDVIDDAEASFMDLFNVNDAEDLEQGDVRKVHDKVHPDVNLVGSTEPSLAKRKGAKKRNMEPLSYPTSDIGMGGTSTWDDE